MTKSREDVFLRELEESDGVAGLDTLASAANVPTVASDPRARGRLLDAAQLSGRLWRFADQVAELLDVDIGRARALLDSVDDPSVWVPSAPGVESCWVEGGPRVRNAVRGFVRVGSGIAFPRHQHLGDETILILQGSYLDSVTGKVLRPGDTARMEQGSEHDVLAPADGMDLLTLVVVFNGVRVADQVHAPRS